MKLASINSPSLFFPFVKIRLVFNFCRCTPPLKFLMANFSRITVFTSENTFVWEYDKSKNLLIGPHKVLLVCSGCPCQTGNFSYVYNQEYIIRGECLTPVWSIKNERVKSFRLL